MTARSTPPGTSLHQRFAFQETARILALIAVAWWLLHPFATSRQIGSGDALWYANMLADFVTQLRNGVFPIFVGQTDWAWNGAVYPLRVAPLYQHWGGLIDTLTGHQLGFFALQHAIVIVSGALGLTSAYLCLRAIDPVSPWRACVLACVYLSCPGVLGTIYTQDLYMTWMVLPFLPLAVLGLVRTFDRDDVPAQLLLAAGLAGAWLAHAPVALWLTFIVSAVEVVKLCTVHRRVASWRRAGLGAAMFVLLGSYPFVSVATLKIPGAASLVASGLAHDQQIMQSIREVFPRVLQPLSEGARALSDLQLGYGLWLVAGSAAALCLVQCTRPDASPRTRQLATLLLAACAVLLLLLLPVPFITDWLWAHVPGQIKRITFYWPMHRFYLLLAVLLTAALQLAARGLSPGARTKVIVIASIALAWSLWESRQFARAGREITATEKISVRALLPENRMLMQHSYGLFESRPPYFSHGVTAPWAEFRLIEPAGERPVAATNEAATWVPLTGVLDANPAILNLQPKLVLAPGRRYELLLRVREPVAGILQLAGPTFFREYQLPNSGDSKAFGLLPGNSPRLALWTSALTPEEVQLRFIPTPGRPAREFRTFGTFSLIELSPDGPVELISSLPLVVKVRAERPMVLETPRMFTPGYTARVNGLPVTVAASSYRLLTVTVPAGESIVVINYRAPWPLALAYETTGISWIALVIVVISDAIRRSRGA